MNYPRYFRKMTTKMSSQPPVMFKTNFGFRGGGLRNPLFGGNSPVQGVQYSSLPCHVQADQRDSDNNYDSLKYEGENTSTFKGLISCRIKVANAILLFQASENPLG